MVCNTAYNICAQPALQSMSNRSESCECSCSASGHTGLTNFSLQNCESHRVDDFGQKVFAKRKKKTCFLLVHVQKRPCVQPKYFMAPNFHSRQCTMNHREVRQSENPTNISILEKKPCDSMSTVKLSTDCDRVICAPLKIQTLPYSQAVELHGPDMVRSLDVCQEAYTVRIRAKSDIVA